MEGAYMLNENVLLHIREYGGVLAIPEKKALLWLAARTPRQVNSDHLTLLGLASMLMAGASYWAASRNKWALLLAIACLAVNWLGDSLDGTIARYRSCQRPRYGYYVDHVIDLIGTAALLAGLAFSGYMTTVIAMALLAAFALVEAEVFLSTHVQQVFRLSCFCVGPTELRILLAGGTAYLLHSRWVHLSHYGPFLLFDVGGMAAIAGLIAALLYSAIRNSHRLYLEEPACPRPVTKGNAGL
jgi:archaetidylinositol phosphate synthase